MQAIFRLLKDHRMRAISHIVRDFVTAMGWQAVQHNGIGMRLTNQITVHLIWGESRATGGG